MLTCTDLTRLSVAIVHILSGIMHFIDPELVLMRYFLPKYVHRDPLAQTVVTAFGTRVLGFGTLVLAFYLTEQYQALDWALIVASYLFGAGDLYVMWRHAPRAPPLYIFQCVFSSLVIGSTDLLGTLYC